MIYYELERRNQKQMGKVVSRGTVGAVILYVVVGIFGYLTFINSPTGETPEEALDSQNILEAPYGNSTPILVGNFALFFAITAASPLVVLPAKDSVEEFREKGTLSGRANLIVTFCLVFVCYALATAIPSIGDAMTIVGSTTNPAVGFILPIVFYWK